MNDERPRDLLSADEGSTSDIKIEWRDSPNFLVDTVVGYVTVAGIPRVTLGAIHHFPSRLPAYLPTVTISSSVEGLRFIAAQLLEIADGSAKFEANEGADDVAG